MFNLLKKKLADWLGSSKPREEKPVVEEVKEARERAAEKSQLKKKSAFDKKIIKKARVVGEETDSLEQEIVSDIIEGDVRENIENVEKRTEKVEKPGFFSKLRAVFTSQRITDEFFDERFNDLELILLENNVALSVVDDIRSSLKSKLVGKEFKRDDVESRFKEALKETISSLLIEPDFDVISRIKDYPSTFVVLFCGINGSGKTTSLAKFASFLKRNGISSVFAASDTFRAASIEQLALHGRNLSISVVKQAYGSDPAAVAFDAIQYAKSKKIKVVLIDTAGRMHTKQNLIDEMSKIVRVAKPDLKVFVGESITGNDATEQARIFNEAIDIDGIILTKADVDEKGGTAISVSKVTGKPIFYLGTGQDYDSLEKFDKGKILNALGL